MNLFNRGPDDWQIATKPEVKGRSREVTATLREVPFLFSPSRNAAAWIPIEGDDFPIWLLVEADKNVLWARAKTSFLMKKSWQCAGCGNPIEGEPDGTHIWKFELQPPAHAPFSVEIEMPGVRCDACGEINAFERYSGGLGEALGEAEMQIDKL